jgi:hypothetical protein
MKYERTRDGTKEPEKLVSTVDSILDRLRDLGDEEFILQVEIPQEGGEYNAE